MIRVQSIVADISGRHAEYGYPGGRGYLLFQSVKVSINRFGFPSSVGKNRVVNPGENALGRQGKERAGLNSRAEGKGAESGLI